MPKRGTIVFVAVLVSTEDQDVIADALNETLRPARLNAEDSYILDYAFNLGVDPIIKKENSPKLPLPVRYKIDRNYTECDFVEQMVDERVMEREADLPIMDQVAEIIAGRDQIPLWNVYQRLQIHGGQEMYEQFIGPAIDKLAEQLEKKPKPGESRE